MKCECKMLHKNTNHKFNRRILQTTKNGKEHKNTKKCEL